MKPIPDHAVNRLRIWRKSVSTRPFLARGGSVPRCDACQLRAKGFAEAGMVDPAAR